ncbi:MAG: helix-turn-helix domain-containing protein [Candidatus Symbiothrix sp.]|jgi:transcriptional regulator with XRE-family HTH domain|nr:helix-turn-helix domain-containing protein [Candidatus Symbiothrix sp.]
MRIKEVLKEKGLTVNEVAIRMGVSAPSLSRAINKNTTVEMLDKIATAVGCSISELIEKPPKPPKVFQCPHCGKDIHIDLT